MIDPADHLGLAYHMARLFANVGERADVRQEAVLALCRAAKRYNREKPPKPFAEFAYLEIRGDLLDHYARQKRWRRVGAAGFDLNMVAAPCDHDAAPALDLIERAPLTPLQKATLIGIYVDGKTIAMLADERGVDSARVWRHEKSGLARLRKWLAA